MSTKGSWQRPCDQKKFNENWEAIFGKNKEEKTSEKETKDESSPNSSNPS